MPLSLGTRRHLSITAFCSDYETLLDSMWNWPLNQALKLVIVCRVDWNLKHVHCLSMSFFAGSWWMWSIGHGPCSKQGGSAGSALSIICNPSSSLRQRWIWWMTRWWMPKKLRREPQPWDENECVQGQPHFWPFRASHLYCCWWKKFCMSWDFVDIKPCKYLDICHKGWSRISSMFTWN